MHPPFRSSWLESPEGRAQREARPWSSVARTLLEPRLVSRARAMQPAPRLLSGLQPVDSPCSLTLTPGRVSDSVPGPLWTEAEAAEKAARTPRLECPTDCLTSSLRDAKEVSRTRKDIKGGKALRLRNGVSRGLDLNRLHHSGSGRTGRLALPERRHSPAA